MKKHWISRGIGSVVMMAALSGAGVLGAGTATAHAYGAPSISTSVSNDGDFHITGGGFTSGRSTISVWLVDWTTNETLYWSGSVQASTAFCSGRSCRIGGQIKVNGPMTYHPDDGVFAPYWTPSVSLGAHCGHNVGAIAKDGDYNDPAAQWSNVSGNIAPACIH